MNTDIRTHAHTETYTHTTHICHCHLLTENSEGTVKRDTVNIVVDSIEG